MPFNSLDYAIFLAATLTISWVLARHQLFRLTFLLLASYFFYMSAMKIYVLLVLGSTVVDYFCGLAIHGSTSEAKRKAFLGLSLTTNLGLLGTFKYFDFFSKNVSDLFHFLAIMPDTVALPLLQVALPVGISFYTFQTMAYTIDVYRGLQQPIQNPIKFALFVTYFPQLVAGPIVLANHLVPQFNRRPGLTSQQVGEGLFRIIKGLTKKVVIADWLALNLIDRVYDAPHAFTSGEITVALWAYSMQIYCDFSGYSDIAIGSAKLFGYELPENFDRPYLSVNVAEFWRRWHMTLSRWIRDYLYFPLGGTRKGELRTYANIFLVLLIMGFWHGANWTFFWYGVIHAVAVCINRYQRVRFKQAGIRPRWSAWQQVWRIFITFQFLSFARILFRSQSMDQAWRVTKAFLNLDNSLVGDTWGWPLLRHLVQGLNFDVSRIDWKVWAILTLAYTIHLSPKQWVAGAQTRFVQAPVIVQSMTLVISLLAVAHLSSMQPVPFIYFQF